ncbi:unnamed protein product [Dracunculus medinensis]|uniref:G_PROTEIN_RECEP_F1_2 domain-containing protein n=1 Tax=Dracunculus medinensis TaxID=318479 RepID=A0A0N4U2Y6_DRAME|nr:unnamed protein product [Dracunculus medinensis]
MDELRLSLYTICIPIILLLCSLAAILNIFVLLSRLHVRSRSNTLELIYSLATSDTWTSIIVAASLFRNSYMTVVLGYVHTSLCFPLTLEALRSGGLLTGMLHLFALAIHHYLSTSKPFDHEQILSRRKIHVIIVLIWTIPPVAHIIYFASWPGQGYRIKNCTVVAFYDHLYFRAIISTIIISLMLSTGYLYSKLLIKLKKTHVKASSSTTWKRRTVVTSGLIFGTFLVGWLPASLLYVLTAEGMPLYAQNSIWLNIFSLTSLVLIMIKSLTNPIIYFLIYLRPR